MRLHSGQGNCFGAKGCLALAVCLLLAAQARASVSALYTFSSNTGVSTDSDANSTAGTFTLTGYGPATKFHNNSVTFGPGGADIGLASEAAAITAANYVSFSVSWAAAVDLDTLTFSLASGAANKAVHWTLLSSIDGFSTGHEIGTGSTSSTTASTQTATFTGSEYDGLTSPVTFRLYLWNGNDNATALMDDVTLNTSLTPVPEPGSLALVTLGLLALAARRPSQNPHAHPGARQLGRI